MITFELLGIEVPYSVATPSTHDFAFEFSSQLGSFPTDTTHLLWYIDVIDGRSIEGSDTRWKAELLPPNENGDLDGV